VPPRPRRPQAAPHNHAGVNYDRANPVQHPARTIPNDASRFRNNRGARGPAFESENNQSADARNPPHSAAARVCPPDEGQQHAGRNCPSSRPSGAALQLAPEVKHTTVPAHIIPMPMRNAFMSACPRARVSGWNTKADPAPARNTRPITPATRNIHRSVFARLPTIRR
jgi:hypothetical protein